MGMKNQKNIVKCVICNTIFYTHFIHKKTCHEICSLQLREINKRKGQKERNIKYKQLNKDKINLQQKERRRNNPIKFSIWRKNSRLKHLNQRRLDEKKWRIANPHKKLANNRKRKGLVNLTSLPNSQEVRKRLKLFNGCCYCGSQHNITLEHLVPISKGGTNAIYNLYGACSQCNSSKGNKLFLKWYRNQNFYNPNKEYNILQHYLAG